MTPANQPPAAPRSAPDDAPHQPVRLLPFRAAEAVREGVGFDADAMARFLGVSAKTYRRRAAAGRLDADESLKTEMLRNALAEAGRVLGDAARARRWLTTPIASLGDARPVDRLNSIDGYERVKATLAKIEYGTY